MAITTVEVRVSAGHPDMPLRPVAAFAGSAVTIGVLDVPKRKCGVDVTSVAVTIENADGTVDTMPAKLVGCAWCATFSAEYFATPGFVQNGLTVTVGGKDENETAREWILGRGDFEVLSAEAVPQPGEAWQNVHYRAEVPENPVAGDLAKVEGAWKLYTDSGWQTLGGGSGGGAVIESRQNPGYAANADHAQDATFAETSSRAEFGCSDENGVNFNEYYAKKKDLIVRLDLVGDGSTASPYAIQLGDEVQTFDQVKTFAETRNAVIRHGQGTYRVTYVGNGEMMWDCTGTVQGVVKSGMIHIFCEGNVVQLVAAKILAEKSEVEAAKSAASEAQLTADVATATADYAYDFSRYPILEVTDGELLDRTVNTASTVFDFTFPAAVGGARDFVLVIEPSATPPSVSFPADVTYVAEEGEDPFTAEANKINEWYFHENGTNRFAVAHKSWGTVTQQA